MREIPSRFAIFEKEPRMNAKPNQVIYGPYSSMNEAEEYRIKYCGTNGNYFCAQIASDHVSPKYE